MTSNDEWGKLVILNPEAFDEIEDETVLNETASLIASGLQEAYRKISEELNAKPTK